MYIYMYSHNRNLFFPWYSAASQAKTAQTLGGFVGTKVRLGNATYYINTKSVRFLAMKNNLKNSCLDCGRRSEIVWNHCNKLDAVLSSETINVR